MSFDLSTQPSLTPTLSPYLHVLDRLTKPEIPVDAAVKLLAEVLDVTPTRLAKMVGVHFCALQNFAEKKVDRDTITTLVKFIDKNLLSSKKGSIQFDTLCNIRENVISGFIANKTGFDKLVSFWATEVGFSNIRSGSGLSYATIHGWRNGALHPTFKQLCSAADKFGHNLNDPSDPWSEFSRAVWTEETAKLHKVRGIPSLISKFATLVELSEITFDSPNLVEKLGIRIDFANKLAIYEFVPFQNIKESLNLLLKSQPATNFLETASLVYELNECRRKWESERLREDRGSLAHAVKTYHTKQGINFGTVAWLLGIHKEVDPGIYIREVLYKGRVSEKAPVGLILRAIGDKNFSKDIKELWFRERRTKAERLGSSLTELRFNMEFWGVSTLDLSAFSRSKKISLASQETLRKIEQGRKPISPKAMAYLIDIVKMCAQDRLEGIDVLKDLRLRPRSIENLKHVAEDLGGYGRWSLLSRKFITTPGLNPSGERIKKFVEGDETQIVSLPILKSMLVAAGSQGSDSLFQDWAYIQASVLEKKVSPLARVLTAYILTKSTSVGAAVRDAKYRSRKPLENLLDQADLWRPSWDRIERLLNAFGDGQDSLTYDFVRRVWESDGDIKYSLAAWRRNLGERLKPGVESYINLPGVTKEECPGARTTFNGAPLNKSQMENILKEVLMLDSESKQDLDAIIAEMSALPITNVRYRAYMGDWLSWPGNPGRLKIFAERAKDPNFKSISDHPLDNNIFAEKFYEIKSDLTHSFR